VSERGQDDWQTYVFLSHMHITAEMNRFVVKEEIIEYIGRNVWSGFSVFSSDFVVNLIRINGYRHCTIIM